MGFGGLFGLAVLSVFEDSISVIVIGIGAVLMGIAINYPLHILVHQRYTQIPQEKICDRPKEDCCKNRRQNPSQYSHFGSNGKTCDHIIDLGPEGGNGGGTLVAEGTPEEVAKCEYSFTGEYLRKKLQ